jgi:hypothetical protein
MRSKRDAKINRQVRQKIPSPAGGKALRRLFTYLAERDPSLNLDVVRTLVIPKATIPKFVLPKAHKPGGRGPRPCRSGEETPWGSCREIVGGSDL